MSDIGGFVAGSIVGKLLLDKSGWDSSIKAIAKDEVTLANLGGKIGQAFKVSAIAIAAAGAAVATAMGAIIKKTADAGDELWDMSQRTGVAVETLSGLKLAADKSGTSIEGLAVGLRFLGKSMVGNPALFTSLGIAVKDATGNMRPMQDVMLEVADRFSGMEDGAEKTALAIQIFGRSGTELISMLNLGSAGLREQIALADKLGTTFTAKAAAAADRFNDALVDLRGAFTGMRNDIGNALIPVFTQLIENMTTGLAGVREKVAELAGSKMFADWAVGIARAFVTAFQVMAKAVEGLILIIQAAQGAIFKAGQVIVGRLFEWSVQLLGLVQIASKVVPGLKGIEKEVWGLVQDLAAVSVEYKSLADQKFEGASDTVQIFQTLNKILDDVKLSFTAVGDSSTKAAADTASGWNKAMLEFANYTRQVLNHKSPIIEPIPDILAASELPGPRWETLLTKQLEWLGIYKKESQKTTDAVAHFFDGLYNDIARGFADAFEQLFSGTKKFADFWKSIWTSIKQTFFRILGEMVAGFMVTFIKGLMTGMKLLDALSGAFGAGSLLGVAGKGAVAAAPIVAAAPPAAAAGGALGETMVTGAAGASATAGSAIIASWVIPVAFAAVWLGAVFGTLFGKSAADKWEESYSAAMEAKLGPGWEAFARRSVSSGSLRAPASEFVRPVDFTGQRSPNGGTLRQQSGDMIINFHVEAFDGPDLHQTIRTKIIPTIREAARRREFWVPIGSAGGV